MKILPPVTRPPDTPITRRHLPRPARHWSAYRSCLRWDFGFTCALCLIHEADLYGGHLGEGLGGTTTEHRTPRSADPGRANDYDNCLYACRLCNTARGNRPERHQGTRLLDPTEDAWSLHFLAADDLLRPADGDAAAAYTHLAYDLDDPRKTERRLARRALVNDRLLLLRDLETIIAEQLELADSLRQKDLESFGRVLQRIRSIRLEARRALGDLKRYAVVPADAPRQCRCGASGDRSLPAELDCQAIEVPETVGGDLPASA